MIPAMNSTEVNLGVSFEELVVMFSIMKSMEIQRLPERRMYWSTKDDGVFKALNYGRFMSMYRFETIIANLKFSRSEDPDKQIQDFIEACNMSFQAAVAAGDSLTVDESMVKSYHRGLKGKMKIIRKPRPIGNEF